MIALGPLPRSACACSGAGDLQASKKCLGTEEKQHLHIITTRSIVIWEPVFHKGYAIINPTPSAAIHTKLAYTVDTKFFRIPCRYPLGLPTQETHSQHIYRQLSQELSAKRKEAPEGQTFIQPQILSFTRISYPISCLPLKCLLSVT